MSLVDILKSIFKLIFGGAKETSVSGASVAVGSAVEQIKVSKQSQVNYQIGDIEVIGVYQTYDKHDKQRQIPFEEVSLARNKDPIFVFIPKTIGKVELGFEFDGKLVEQKVMNNTNGELTDKESIVRFDFPNAMNLGQHTMKILEGYKPRDGGDVVWFEESKLFWVKVV